MYRKLNYSHISVFCSAHLVAEVFVVFTRQLLYVLQHPYPTEEQKKSLSSVTGLNLLQINNW